MAYKVPQSAFLGGFFPLFAFAFLCGIPVYFALPSEPSLGNILALSILALVLAVIFILISFKKGLYYWWLGLGIFGLALSGFGVFYATFYAQNVQTPFWPENLKDTRVWLNGTVKEVTLRSKGYGTLKIKDVTTFHPDVLRHWPHMLIITHNSRLEDIEIGSTISLQARLKPPTSPPHPTAYDWQRRSFFERTSAIGFVMGEMHVTPPFRSRLEYWLRQKRENIAHSLSELRPKAPETGIGIALLTGLRGLIPEEIRRAYTESGLAHVMAISGMHLGMLAGFIYILMRFLFVRMGSFALYCDIRKPAAFIAFIAACCYALLAGATIPTLRALALIAAAFIALVVGRIHLGGRILAFAALCLGIYNPFWVIGPSYQLSFVASFALLLWVYAQKREKLFLGELAPKRGHFTGLLKASVIATLATTPLVALHFSSVPVLGVLANMVAIPFFGFVVLPLGFLWLFAPIFLKTQLGGLYLNAVSGLSSIAVFFADFSWGVFTVPEGALPFIFVIAWGLLLLFFRPGRWVHAAIGVGIICLLVVINTQERLIITSNPEGTSIFTGNVYENLEEDAPPPVWLNKTLMAPSGLEVQCTVSHCSYWQKNIKGGLTAFTLNKPPFSLSTEDCAYSHWLFSTDGSPAVCPEKDIRTHFKIKNGQTFDVFLLKDNTISVKKYKPALRIWNKVM